MAWLALGGAVCSRTNSLDRSLSREMRSLWGPEVLVQASPFVATGEGGKRTDADSVAPSSSQITADITHDNRYKGLLWFSTFTVDFDATYTFDASTAGAGIFIFELPRGVTGYDSLSVEVNGKPHSLANGQVAAGRIAAAIDRAAANTVRVHYTTNGQDVWLYSPSGVSQIYDSYDEWERHAVVGSEQRPTSLSNFSLTINTDFRKIDYPRGTRSPNEPASVNNGGQTAVWAFKDALTSQSMGIVMPKRANAGPIIQRMSFFAPVSLFFFFTVLFTVVVLKKIPLHPMHYLFIAAGFFAFHILLAYLADKIAVQTAFWICAVVSMLLVVSYMRLVAGVKFAVAYVGLAQLVYLLGFSYAFFFPGWTGLTVVVGAVATLFVLMQSTGRVDWSKVFGRNNSRSPVEPPPLSMPQE
ncbi:MAG: inner membrane CreD family protein [Planctomycetota bacterium]